MAKIQKVPTADTCTDSKPVEHAQNDARYNVFANDLQHSEQSESVINTCLVETDDSNDIPDSPDMFVTIVKQQHKLDEVSYHKFFDILKQYQKEVNELHAERLARNANPLALVVAAQANQDPYYQTSRDNDMQKNLALIAKYFKKIYKPTNNNLRTSSNSKNKNVDTTLRYKNDDHSGQLWNQRTMNVTGARENVGSSELEAHYRYMAKIQKVPTADTCTDSKPVEHVQNDARYNVFANDLQHSEQSESVINTCLVETDDSNDIPDSPDMCDDDI
nr:hypothetical protein [Tanacetum cinerariifolium]